MDERTEAQKLADTAANSERRVIGSTVSDKILVIAPAYEEARRWAHEHAVIAHQVVYVGPFNFEQAAHGVHGAQHVILHWSRFTEGQREQIKMLLNMTQSVPFEGDAGVDAPVPDVWS